MWRAWSLLRLIRFYAIQHEGVIPLRLLQIELKHMMLKHPLNSKWTLWFYKNESRNWEENQRQVVPQIMLHTKKTPLLKKLQRYSKENLIS